MSDLTEVVLSYDIRFEIQLCDGHYNLISENRDHTPAVAEYLTEATTCGSCNIVGAEFHDDIEDLELEEVMDD